MWDVKKRRQNSSVVLGNRFISTMWDVKDEGDRKLESAKKFYLDYVGCKVYLYSLLFPCILVFYLDYVGCKEDRRGLSEV